VSFKARRELKARVAAVSGWEHSLDLGHGIRTPGRRSATVLARERSRLGLAPDLTGKTVLDVCARDGFFAFEAERRGAARVAVLGATPGFAVAREALGSTVRALDVDFADGDLDALGAWDVVLHLGVLSRMENPLGALRRLAAVTRELAIVETEAVAVPAFEDQAVWRFFPGDELDGDAANWWAPNLPGLGGALTAAGFAGVRGVIGPPDEWLARPTGLLRYRAVAHGLAELGGDR
jgi:tRNA (mo5U34)-methyltransferase